MKLSTAGAGSDKDVVAVPTEDNLPPMDRVQALIDGATSLEAYQVSPYSISLINSVEFSGVFAPYQLACFRSNCSGS